MADTSATDTQKRPGVIEKAGQPERADLPIRKAVPPATGDDSNADKDKAAQAAAAAALQNNNNQTDKDKLAADAAKLAADKTTDKPAVDEEAIKAFFKEKGIEYTSADDLKKKLTSIPGAEPTEDEKKQAAAARDKRMLDLHIARGGTPEQWVNYQKMASGEPAELGKLKIQADLLKEGFTADEAAVVIKKMHFDVSDEELAEMDEADQKLIKKEREFGAKKLAARGSFIKQNAQAYFDDIVREMTDKDTDATQKKQHASNVEAALSAYQRKQVLEIGKVDEKDVLPVDFELPETVIAQAKELLSDRAKLESQIFNKDGSFNLDFLTPLVINSLSNKNAVKTSYLTGETRGIEAALKNFSSKKPDLGGTNGAGQGQKGKLASAGEPQVAQLPSRK